MIRRNRDNKIKIPWYSRRVPRRSGEDDLGLGGDFTLRIPVMRPRPQPVTVRQPTTQPATQPAAQPDTAQEPVPIPEPLPFPFPLPERQPQQEPRIIRPPFREPQPVPQLLSFQLGYDWETHIQRAAEQTEELKPVIPEPEPEPSSPIAQAFSKVMQPILYLTVGREMLDQYVTANITDPIYSRMLDDPVLGVVLREAEKAEMDLEALANYFAQYDWDNMDTDQMLDDLTVIIGAAEAARIIGFFIGRKVLFRI